MHMYMNNLVFLDQVSRHKELVKPTASLKTETKLAKSYFTRKNRYVQ